jgi:hypothetical protein
LKTSKQSIHSYDYVISSGQTDFDFIAASLFKLPCKDLGNESGPLPPEALNAFLVLQ